MNYQSDSDRPAPDMSCVFAKLISAGHTEAIIRPSGANFWFASTKEVRPLNWIKKVLAMKGKLMPTIAIITGVLALVGGWRQVVTSALGVTNGSWTGTKLTWEPGSF